MEIIRYKNDFKDEWDGFVGNSRNGTLFHTRRFLSYHKEDKFVDHSLIVLHNKKVVSVFPAIEFKNSSNLVLKSHGGSSYGGPIFNVDSGLSVVKDVLESIEDYAVSKGFSSIEMRIAPRVYHIYPSEDVDYALWYLGYNVVSAELSSAVQLFSETNESLENIFRCDTRRSIDKAYRAGIKVCVSDDWSSYWDILRDNLQVKHRTIPTHTLDEIMLLKSICKEEINLYAAYYNNNLISGTVVFRGNSSACHTFYIAQDYDFQKLRSLNLVFYILIKKLYKDKYRYLNFGISTESGGTAINDGLFRFKEGFGARGTIRRYYRKEI